MAERPNRIRKLTDSLGLEIDRLIRTLPGADPKLQGDPEPDPMSSPAGTTRAVGAGTATLTTGSTPASSAAMNAARARRNEFLGAWGRALAAGCLAMAVAYWPYSTACGSLLQTYLVVVGAVLLAGSWASWFAWRAHSATAHVIGLIVVYWGIVLAAEQLLPRIGYAAVAASWRCGA